METVAQKTSIADVVPQGWAFCSADFSIIAAGGNSPGNVGLVRAGESRKHWHQFADADVIPLHVFGCGMTFEDALLDAVEKARIAPPVMIPVIGG